MHWHFLTNGVWIAILAHGLVGVSLIWDKVLLQRPATKSVPNYVFWLGAISIFGLILIPFGFRLPSAKLAGTAVGAGAIQMAAIWFYYTALKRGEASETLAVMGGFDPLFTALIAIPLLSKPLGGESVIAFAVMVGGGFAMFAAEKVNWGRILPSVLLSAGLFGLTNVLQKVVFNSTNFVSGYVFFTIGTFLGAMSLLIRPSWRHQIFQQSEDAPPRSKLWYFVNRFISGVGSFLIFLAISRTSPAIVSAIAGERYVIIFFGAFLLTKVKPEWLREDFGRRALIGKIIGTGLIVAGLILVGLGGRSTGGGGEARLDLPAPPPFDFRQTAVPQGAQAPAHGRECAAGDAGRGGAEAILRHGVSTWRSLASEILEQLQPAVLRLRVSLYDPGHSPDLVDHYVVGAGRGRLALIPACPCRDSGAG